MSCRRNSPAPFLRWVRGASDTGRWFSGGKEKLRGRILAQINPCNQHDDGIPYGPAHPDKGKVIVVTVRVPDDNGVGHGTDRGGKQGQQGAGKQKTDKTVPQVITHQGNSRSGHDQRGKGFCPAAGVAGPGPEGLDQDGRHGSDGHQNPDLRRRNPVLCVIGTEERRVQG